ncbi:tetratricopeptide repeat protein [Thermocrinis minervae]|uniref:Tetratricopeptide repeat-containing protein n=1 Tax=Thermocrinis minervae TaxID=381751 RepID=A0A1M6S5M6_9AQUI|nr:tetratricopeptide repeat protein [Thermocrinis minervae]SHK40023.1 Tetratricopeptide repeat-containing protein [Thermocrinis minervae]
MRIFLLFLLFVYSCSVPKIVILDYPLTAEEYLTLGYIYEKEGKLDVAQRYYEKAISKDRRLWKAYFNLGNVYTQKMEYERAQEAYEKAIALKPNDPDILNNLAYVLYKQGKPEEAYPYIKKALSIQKKPEYLSTLRQIEEALKFKGESW